MLGKVTNLHPATPIFVLFRSYQFIFARQSDDDLEAICRAITLTPPEFKII